VAADLGIPSGTRYTGAIALEFDARGRGGVALVRFFVDCDG
jgi:hypothetical protein